MARTIAAIGIVLLWLAGASVAAAAEVQRLTPHDETRVDTPQIALRPPAELRPDTPSAPSPDNNGSTYSAAETDVAQPPLQTRHFGAQAVLECRLDAQPGGLVVVNRSLEALPPGTRIKWQFPDARMRGFFALIGPLEPGETLVADNVVDDAPDARGACVARVI